jgi:hypothetical protein
MRFFILQIYTIKKQYTNWRFVLFFASEAAKGFGWQKALRIAEACKISSEKGDEVSGGKRRDEFPKKNTHDFH